MTAVRATCPLASTRSTRDELDIRTHRSTHTAQATCRLGTEANLSTCWDSEELPASHDPNVCEATTTSTKPEPDRSRGGATGRRTKTTSAAPLIRIRAFRADRYSGAR